MKKLLGLIGLLALLIIPGSAFAATQPTAVPLPAELSLALMQQEPAPAQAFDIQTVLQQDSHQQSIPTAIIHNWVCSRSCTLCGSDVSGYCPPGAGQCVPYCP